MQRPQFNARRVRKTLFLLMCLPLGALALTGCALKPRIVVEVPLILKEPCEAKRREVVTIGDLAAYSVDQETALQTCEAKRKALVDILNPS